jgi:hypothetical protein
LRIQTPTGPALRRLVVFTADAAWFTLLFAVTALIALNAWLALLR